MDIENRLAEDFLFLLELCKQPESVFPSSSKDYALARCWLDMLSRYDCETVDDRRLRNVYMSHLTACLNDGKLIGPFREKPITERLEPVDFHTIRAKAKCKPPCPNKGRECTIGEGEGEDVDKPSENIGKQGENQQAGAFYCCCGECPRCCPDVRYAAEELPNAPQREYFCGYMTQQLNPPAFLSESKNGLLALPPCHVPPAKNNIATHIPTLEECRRLQHLTRQLLEAIAAELRGHSEPGSNDYLEQELARYRNFIKNYTNMAMVLEKLHAKPTLRSFLLLNLQNDLIKLLSDATIMNLTAPPEQV